MKRTLFKLLLLFVIIQNSGCYDAKPTYQGAPYDPNKPVLIDCFSPDTGGINSTIVIEGDNFGLDTSKIAFYFGEKRATLTGLNGEAAIVQMPKQPGDSTYLSVVYCGDTSVFEAYKFKYKIQAMVSTVSGKAKESGNKDGGFQDRKSVV